MALTDDALGSHPCRTMAMLLAMPDTTGYAARAGRALDAAMYYRGMEINDLAVAIGVNRGTLYRWIRGETDMSAAHAAAIIEALDAPPEILVRPPETRERALAMMAVYDELRAAAPPRGPSHP